MVLLNFFQYFAAEIVREGLLGFLTAIRNLISALFQGNFGNFSDKKGRKLFLLIGFYLSFTATTLLIFSYNQAMLIVVAIVHAFSFSIIIPVWNATLGDVTEIKGRTTFIGKLSSVGQSVGVILMLIVASLFIIIDLRFNNMITIGGWGYTLNWEIQYGIIFAICAINLLICGIGILFLRETRRFEISIKQPKLLTAFKNKQFRKFIIVNSFFGITMAALWPIYPVIQVKIIDMEFYQLIIVAAIYAILFSLGNFFGGLIADRIGRKPVLIFSRIFMFSVSLLYIPAVLYQSWYWVIFTNSVSGMGNGIFIVVMNAYALDMSTEENLGSYSGLTQVSWGIATFIGSFIAGFIAQSISDRFGEITMVLSTTIAIAIMRVFASIGYFFIKESLIEENSTKN
ncbi:MAG: MFS transporter [Asgard group archaeon]|nr:MFS transporter [Asgard group archaeon]